MLALLCVVAAGCGHENVAGTAKLHRSAPPVVPNAPATHIADVAFLARSVGFLAAKGRIQRTTDGGRDWSDVWHRAGANLEWIAFADPRHGFAGGDGFILRTVDGGKSWRRGPMSLPVPDTPPWVRVEPDFVTPATGFAVTDPTSFGRSVFLRTADGGAHWSRIRGPQYVRDVDFVSARTGFALGSKLYRTDDAGVTWRTLALPHVPYALAAIDFLDTRRGFVAGGNPAMTETAPAQALFTTRDGGLTWEQRYVNPHRGFSLHGGDPFARLHFVDAENGWATTGLCKCCPSGPCAGGIYVTHDSGRSWRRLGAEIQFSAVSAKDAWALPYCDLECDVLLRTTDSGRSWRPIARVDRLRFSEVEVRRQRLVLSSLDTPDFVSSDGGRAWRLGTVGPRRVRGELGQLFYADETCGPRTPYLQAGRTLRVTFDDGASWKRLQPPVTPAAVDVAQGLVVVAGLQDCRATLAVKDGGEPWKTSAIPADCVPSIARDDVWLACIRVLLQSGDRGRHWRRLSSPAEIQAVAPSGHASAWIVADHHLWRTEDGGGNWTEAWPSLPTRG